jgi:hypothetical protein
MDQGAANGRGRNGWLRRLLYSAGALAALSDVGAAAMPQAAAEGGGYRAAGAVPMAWQEFARQLQGHFERWLASDDDAARRIQEHMAKGALRERAPPSLIVRAWISPVGGIERVECDDLDDLGAVTLQALLTGVDVGPPPSDMLQPVHLRLSLGPDDQPRQEP